MALVPGKEKPYHINMKKLIILFTAFLFTFAPVWGQHSKNADLDKRLQISIRTHTTNKNLEMQRTLRQETDINLLKDISWQEFLRLNEKAKERLLVSTRLEAKALELELKENPNMVFSPQIEYKNAAPDYSHAFTHKYIFISENISHDTKSAPQEVINILKAARNARPNAKILLAQEFLIWTGESNASLLKKPGQNSELYSGYPEVTQAADKLGIDQLALDDAPYYAEDKNVFVKLGKFLVEVTPQDKLPLLSYTKCDDPLYNRWASAYQFIGISPFGVLERNYQWARRIKAVEKNYDLILVYAGSGHLSNTSSNDLQTLLKCKDFAHIELLPTDPTDQAVEKNYETRFLKGEQYGITNDQQQNQEESRLQEQATRGTIYKQSLDQIAEETYQSYKNWKNKKLPLWFSLTKEDFLQANPNYKTPNALKNDIVFHCIYAVILAEPRVEQEQKPEVCPAPKTMLIGPKHKSYI